MLFVGMLSFQLAGALILLLNGLKGTEDAVIKNCFPGSNIVERDEHDNCTIPREQLRKFGFRIFVGCVQSGVILWYSLHCFKYCSCNYNSSCCRVLFEQISCECYLCKRQTDFIQ